MIKKQNNRRSKGMILVTTIIFGSISILMITALSIWFAALFRSSKHTLAREQSFQIAESGINYYRWHLAHAPVDYKDGTNIAGPYVHQFFDKDGNQVGTFSLTITPPPVGSTVVTIKSTGTVVSDPGVERTITAKFAIPSFAKFALVANNDLRFGSGTEMFGPVHSNGGIRFDGLAHNLVTSAKSNYNDPDHSGNNEFGVHTHVNASPSSGVNDSFRATEAPPSAVANRTDVFMSGRQFPVPAADFTGITSDLANMKTLAQTAGRYFAPSGALGYQIILKTNDTFDLHRVTSLAPAPNNCTNVAGQDGWGTWSIQNKTFLANYAIPSNGIVFAEDHVWVEGTIDTARVTIASGRFPDNTANRTSITINNDLLYTNYDGQDVIALIAQNNINVGLISDTNLRIDAALVAQNGRAGRYYYDPNANWPASGGQSRCSPYHSRTSLILYGMIATNLRYGFAYTDGTGYATRNISYDASLLYGPPPSFPLTSDQYQIISWEENEKN